MTQYGFLIDLSLCTGCHCCWMACKETHDLAPGVSYRHIANFDGGDFPDMWAFSLSLSCNHCATPKCESVCPVGAISKDEETGLVVQDQSMCIGCERCVESCPYEAPRYDATKKVSGKCDGCIGALTAGELPQCVAACSTRTLKFGEMEELMQAYGSPDFGNSAWFLPEPTTSPSLLIRPKSGAMPVA